MKPIQRILGALTSVPIIKTPRAIWQQVVTAKHSTYNRPMLLIMIKNSKIKDYKRETDKLSCEVFHYRTLWNTCSTFDLKFCLSVICSRSDSNSQSRARQV